MRLPDVLESRERAAEDQYLEATDGLPDGFFRCACGTVELESEMYFLSPDPYAMPACRVCLAELINDA